MSECIGAGIIMSEDSVKEGSEQHRGEKGVLGESSAGDRVKRLWRADHTRMSLKMFARKLAASGDQDAKDWFECKREVLNEARSDKNVAAAQLASAASKNARRKTGKK